MASVEIGHISVVVAAAVCLPAFYSSLSITVPGINGHLL